MRYLEHESVEHEPDGREEEGEEREESEIRVRRIRLSLPSRGQSFLDQPHDFSWTIIDPQIPSSWFRSETRRS